jgi:hypothetical protein
VYQADIADNDRSKEYGHRRWQLQPLDRDVFSVVTQSVESLYYVQANAAQISQ